MCGRVHSATVLPDMSDPRPVAARLVGRLPHRLDGLPLSVPACRAADLTTDRRREVHSITRLKFGRRIPEQASFRCEGIIACLPRLLDLLAARMKGRHRYASPPSPPTPPHPLVGCSGFDRDEEKHDVPRDVWCSQLTSTSSHVCWSKPGPTISVAVAACLGWGCPQAAALGEHVGASAVGHPYEGGGDVLASTCCLPACLGLPRAPVLRTWGLPSSPVSSAPVDGGNKSVLYMMAVKGRVKLTPRPPSCRLLYCSQLNKARLHHMHRGEKTKYKTNQ